MASLGEQFLRRKPGGPRWRRRPVQTPARASCRAGIGLLGLVGIGVGGTVGTGIFFVLSEAVPDRRAGGGLLLSCSLVRSPV